MLARTVLVAVFLFGVPASAWSKGNFVTQAEHYLGGNPTGWRHNWCAEFLNRFVLRPLGFSSGSASVLSFLTFSHVVPKPGVVAVMRGHVGIVEAVGRRQIRIISGNWGHRVAFGMISRRAVVAYVMPGRRFRS